MFCSSRESLSKLQKQSSGSVLKKENTCARVLFPLKLQLTLLKKSIWGIIFHENFEKILRTPFLQSGRLLLKLIR